MTIVFVSVILNVHQVGVADELFRLCGGNYWFVETDAPNADDGKGGTTDFSSRPYLIRAHHSPSERERALRIIREADVMVYGAAPIAYLRERLTTAKLTFVNSERWLKRGLINFLSPRLLRFLWFYHSHCHGKPVYALCSSAYAAADFRLMLAFRQRCFKWGYFTQCEPLDIVHILDSKRNDSCIRILWCGRFIGWKHPETMIALAERLRHDGIPFVINMIGSGELSSRIQQQIESNLLENHVRLLGSVSNDEVLRLMRSHHIACFTSDRREGWGAVLGEAMSNGCCPVSSVATGATPYLIRDGVNGLSFDLNRRDDLHSQVLRLIRHPEERERMTIEAFRTMRDVWSPAAAASRFHRLCVSLLDGTEPPIAEGPASLA
ncbi:MAG: glycosyltransferase [Bacteroidaceae bacterium]|nr:glycosyltransferase [Bacteroidaceae bacterium]